VTTAIFLNGTYEDDAFYLERFRDATFVIAADGGHAFLHRHGRWPHLLVGDFDSLDAGLVREAQSAGVEVVRHPVRKDSTDAELAVAEARARRDEPIVLLGALGGAFDHQLGHVVVLRGLAEAGCDARLVAPGFTMRVAVGPSIVTLSAPVGVRVSLVSLTAVAVVTLRGLEYPLVSAPLPATSSLGLSNAVAASGATIELEDGVLVIMVCDDDDPLAAAVPE
jgi:thiamine pyrophosphokinase